MALVIGVLSGSAIIPAGADADDVQVPGRVGELVGLVVGGVDLVAGQGLFGGSPDWSLIRLGGAIGVAVVLVNVILHRMTRFALPPLAAGMGCICR